MGSVPQLSWLVCCLARVGAGRGGGSASGWGALRFCSSTTRLWGIKGSGQLYLAKPEAFWANRPHVEVTQDPWSVLRWAEHLGIKTPQPPLEWTWNPEEPSRPIQSPGVFQDPCCALLPTCPLECLKTLVEGWVAKRQRRQRPGERREREIQSHGGENEDSRRVAERLGKGKKERETWTLREKEKSEQWRRRKRGRRNSRNRNKHERTVVLLLY